MKDKTEEERKQNILYNEMKETTESWVKILEKLESSELKETEAKNKLMLSFEDLEKKIIKIKEEWGIETFKETWTSFRSWKRRPILCKTEKVKEKIPHQNFSLFRRKVKDLEECVRINDYNIIEKSSKNTFLQKLFKSLSGH